MKRIFYYSLLSILVVSSCKKTIIIEQDQRISFPNELTAGTPYDQLTQVNLEWADNSDNEKGFKIERKQVGGDFLLVGTTGENTRHYTETPPLGNTYTYRVYAFNDNAHSEYSNEASVILGGLPVLITEAVERFEGTCHIKIRGSINDGGGTARPDIWVYEGGFCWDTKPNPTLGSNKTTTVSFNGIDYINSFSTTLYNFSLGTTYYIRAYAINQVGASYGNEYIYRTSDSALVGSDYQGGTVFYLLKPGDMGYDPSQAHGLIVDTTNLKDVPQLPWTNHPSGGASHPNPIGAMGSAIGTGKGNTNTIIAALGTGNYAAKRCYDLVLNGYSDWFLPSEQELITLYSQYAAITGNISIGLPAPCWTSTEAKYHDGISYAGLMIFGQQGQFADLESLPYWIMAVRAF